MTATRLVPTDAVLPSLAMALDGQAMRGVFERHVCARRGGDVTVTECHIERVKYRPKRNCIIGYKLKLRDAEGEREQRLCAGIYAPDDAAARYEEALNEANITTPDFAPVTSLPSLNMVVWAFPNERKMTTLPLLIDANQLRQKLLPEVVRGRWGEGWEIVDLAHNISNYFPEHSCCVNATLTLSRVDSGAHRTWEIIGKTRYDDAGAETHRHMAMSWHKQDSDVSYARPLAYQPEHRLLWQERVPGATLSSLLASGAADTTLLIRVARAVGALHGTAVASLCHVLLSDLIDRLIAARDVVSAARPACALGLRRVVDALVTNASRLNLDHEGTWHGDLHSNNILVTSTQVYLVDMDAVSVGPPLADLGSFLAELIYRGCIEGESLDAIRPLLSAAVAAYDRRVAWPVSEADVAWFTASALIRERALRCVTSLKPGRMQTVGNVVAAATRIAEGGLFLHSTPLRKSVRVA
jgi:tRNA A-37 threonylcarbamoyl transferase component Bud32